MLRGEFQNKYIYASFHKVSVLEAKLNVLTLVLENINLFRLQGWKDNIFLPMLINRSNQLQLV